MERLKKYVVLKTKDIEHALDAREQILLGNLQAKILHYRQRVCRVILRDYVVVSEALPFYEEVWKMIENYVDNKVGENQTRENEDG